MVPRPHAGGERLALGSGTSRYAVYIVCDERGGAETMKVEILYFDGCPTYLRAEETLRGVLAREGVEADVELVAVNSDERPRSSGSPAARRSG
jgi:hypothetical protein